MGPSPVLAVAVRRPFFHPLVLYEGGALLADRWVYSTKVGVSCSMDNPWPVQPHPRAVPEAITPSSSCSLPPSWCWHASRGAWPAMRTSGSPCSSRSTTSIPTLWFGCSPPTWCTVRSRRAGFRPTSATHAAACLCPSTKPRARSSTASYLSKGSTRAPSSVTPIPRRNAPHRDDCCEPASPERDARW